MIKIAISCDLSLDLHDPELKKHKFTYPPEIYFRLKLSPKQLKRIQEQERVLREQERVKTLLKEKL